MKKLSERKSLDFLEGVGFKVVERSFFSTKIGLKSSLRKIGINSFMKISGKNLHRTIGKITPIAKTYTGVLEDFNNLKKVKGFRGVILKKKILGKEFFVSFKRRKDSKPFLSIGSLGFNEEGKKGISLKSFPISKIKLRKMFKESKINDVLSIKEKKSFEDFLLSICKFFDKNKKLSKIEISPLFVDGKKSTIVSAKIELN